MLADAIDANMLVLDSLADDSHEKFAELVMPLTPLMTPHKQYSGCSWKKTSAHKLVDFNC